jgi:signal transduction histidine kinase/ActR/RegA family two-component response regulator
MVAIQRFRRVEGWIDRAASDQSRVQHAVFTIFLAASCVASLFGIWPNSSLVRADQRSALRALLLVWACVHPAFFVLSLSKRATWVYSIYLSCACAVLAFVYRTMTLDPVNVVGMELAFYSLLLLLAVVFLPFRACMLFTITLLLAHGIWIWVRFGSASEPMRSAYLLATFVPMMVLTIGPVFASLLLDRYRRRMARYQTELIQNVTRLENEKEEAARRTQVIVQQQQQIFEMHKLEAIGRLAAGVAHDFNNLLTAVLGCASEIKLLSEKGDPIYEAAEVIDRAGHRAAQLTRQLMGFARKGKLQSVPVEAHRLVDEVAVFVARTFEANISIVRRLRALPSWTVGDPSQIHQIVLNLALNARDALPQGGEITFETSVVELGETEARAHDELKAGRYLVLSVSDTGAGIPEEVRGHLFEPFFTTKKQGRGTGMGLAMVYGIVKNHGGAIEVESGSSRGTTLRVFLPSVDPAVELQPALPPRLHRGQGRILVVDDEEVVLTAAKQVLTLLGFETRVARDGEEALKVFGASHSEIDLVILDLAMPVMSGQECFEALKQIDPKVRVLIASGYGLDDEAESLTRQGALGLIEKPFEVEKLSEMLIRAIRATPEPANESQAPALLRLGIDAPPP